LTKREIPGLVQKAEAGDAKAQLLLGHAYTFGFGTRRKDSEALKWYQKSAEQGNAHGQMALCNLYRFGRGVRKDESEAVEWCRKSAEQGLVEAQFELGYLYLQQKNDKEAEAWTRKAAEHGYFKAQTDLAILYAQGRGVPQDHLAAYTWILLARAARCGQPPEICVERDPEADALTQGARDEEAAKLSAEQVAEGRRRASEWLREHGKEPLPAEEAQSQKANFLVSHKHGGYASFRPGNPGLRIDYCFGWITIDKSLIQYTSRRHDDGFRIAPGQLKYAKKSGDSAVQIQLENGKKYTFYPINDQFEYQPPDALLAAITKARGQN
jgi:TPR repeat protein